MKKYGLILLSGILLSGCSDYEEKQSMETEIYPTTEAFEKQMNSPEVVNYLGSCGEIFKTLKTINSKISPQDLKELIDLYNLYKTSPETYQSMLESKIGSMYSKEDIALLKELQDNLMKHKNQLSVSQVFSALSENEKEKLSTTAALRIPSVNEKIFKVSGLTRAMDEESACLKKCSENYRWELVGIASEAVCVAGVAVISACASMGSLTIPALIALIAEYAMMDYALASAERTYNQCKADC